jgi:hypothetical protein
MRISNPLLAAGRCPFLVLALATSLHAQVTNAPVVPEAVYVGRVGAGGGLSVIDLNGFGAGTGNPRFDSTYQSFREGDSYYPLNPNVRFQGNQMRPPLQPGATTRDGGSSGVFTLTRDSALSNVLVKRGRLSSAADMMLGHALDTLINEAPFPFGCQQGGGNLCALNSLGTLEIALSNSGGLQPASFGGPILNTVLRGENPVSWAPHPNPPPLFLPPLWQDPCVPGQEPRAVDNADTGGQNLLVAGHAVGDPNQGGPP